MRTWPRTRPPVERPRRSHPRSGPSKPSNVRCVRWPRECCRSECRREDGCCDPTHGHARYHDEESLPGSDGDNALPRSRCCSEATCARRPGTANRPAPSSDKAAQAAQALFLWCPTMCHCACLLLLAVPAASASGVEPQRSGVSAESPRRNGENWTNVRSRGAPSRQFPCWSVALAAPTP